MGRASFCLSVLLTLSLSSLPLFEAAAIHKRQFSSAQRALPTGRERDSGSSLSGLLLPQVIGCQSCTHSSPCYNSGTSQCTAPLSPPSSAASVPVCPPASVLCSPVDLSRRQNCIRCAAGSSGDCLNTANGVCFSSPSPSDPCPAGTAPCQGDQSSLFPLLPTVDCEGLCRPQSPCLHSGERKCYGVDREGKCPSGTRLCAAEEREGSSASPSPSSSPATSPSFSSFSSCAACAPRSLGSVCVNTGDAACFDLQNAACPPGTVRCLLGPSMWDGTLPPPPPPSETESSQTPPPPPVIPTNRMSREDPPSCQRCSSSLPCGSLTSSSPSATDVCVAAGTAQDASTAITKRNSSLLLFCPPASACCSSFSSFCSYPTRYCHAQNRSDNGWCNEACNRRGPVNCPAFCLCSEREDDTRKDGPSPPGEGEQGGQSALKPAVKILIIVLSAVAGTVIFIGIVVLAVRRHKRRKKQTEEVLAYEDDREEHYRAM